MADSYAQTVADARAEPGAAELVLVERSGAHATVTLNDPGKLNPLGAALTVRLREALTELAADAHVTGLASGAPGADILFHEVCAELGIPTTLCLPVPADAYARAHFRRLDDWRVRFHDLTRARPVIELSDRDELPGWLRRPPTDVWERGNRWVLELALTTDAKDVTLLALWDGKSQGDAAGGTAHLVKLARDTGRVDVRVIDTRRLLD